MSPLRRLALASCFLFSSAALCADAGSIPATGVISERTESRPLRLILAPEFVSMGNGSGATLTGAGIGVGLLYSFAEHWGVGGGLRQNFLVASRLSSLFTALEGRATYAITGSLERQKSEISLGGASVYQAESSSRGGLRFSTVVSQYLFSSTTGVLPYSGMGGALSYELPSNSSISYSLEARMDMLFGSKVTYYPMQLSVGLSFWF